MSPRTTDRTYFPKCLQIAEQQPVVEAEPNEMADQAPASQVNTRKPVEKEREKENTAVMAQLSRAITADISEDELPATPKRAITPRVRTTLREKAKRDDEEDDKLIQADESDQ